MALSDDMRLLPILEDLFKVLTEKERWVVTKRFSLDSDSRWTLEKIGQKFGVTRERIRQIEKIALAKLKRTAPTTNLKLVAEMCLQRLNQNGGLMSEKQLVEEIQRILNSTDKNEGQIIILALSIHSDVLKVSKSDTNRAFYHLVNIPQREIETVIKKAIQFMQKKGDVIEEAKLISDITLSFADDDKQYSSKFILSTLHIDRRLKKTEKGYGLMSWRHVHPRSIRDKAYLILKREMKPLHFQEIARLIESSGFDHKRVTIQAVHNELIRYDQFVLVGRGLYALKEWGYRKGTVADIIEGLLKKKSPLTKQEITNGVLRQRDVKKGTISLNLQKNPHFVRVGRALYALDISRK